MVYRAGRPLEGRTALHGLQSRQATGGQDSPPWSTEQARPLEGRTALHGLQSKQATGGVGLCGSRGVRYFLDCFSEEEASLVTGGS